ncbi:hypothetical protein QFZ22_000034 [Streptomyces canus]|uniref:Ricin B lectin domain-containing protein n=1 Tax=Streptomyces canus TaxID=58343 RepID=A0AAW8F2N6_9ACTN|nr:hypothetical protein [Streptomyces canus]
MTQQWYLAQAGRLRMSGRVMLLAVTSSAVLAFTPYWPSVAESDQGVPPHSVSAANRVDPDDPTVLQPMNEDIFDSFCKDRIGEAGAALATDRQPADAYSLRCQEDDGTLYPSNEVTDWGDVNRMMEDACGWKIQENARYIGRVTNLYKTFSGWQCARYEGNAGAPDFEKWCQSTQQFPQLVNRGRASSRYPAYRWACARQGGGGRQLSISVDEVCQQQYGENTLAELDNPYGRKYDDAWSCFYYGS